LNLRGAPCCPTVEARTPAFGQSSTTPGEGRIELYSSTGQTRLQLGHLRHQIDNKRQQHRGRGADLATVAWGAVRAGQGQLISAHKRPASVQASKQIDVREPITQFDLGQQLIHTLAESAQQRKAKTPDEPKIFKLAL
jgi:type VI secretion system secreted protein VgrG